MIKSLSLDFTVILIVFRYQSDHKYMQINYTLVRVPKLRPKCFEISDCR